MSELRKYKNNIYKIYGYWFFHSLIFAYVIERLFWEQRGITVIQVVYTEIFYAIAVMIFEVPSGALSDFWNRKAMMLMSAICAFLEFFILVFAYSFWQFVLAVVIAALGKALASGTSNAIIYDSLKHLKEEKRFEEVLGKSNFFDYISSLLAALLGAFIASKGNYEVNYWLSLVSIVVSFIIALTLVEPRINSAKKSEKYNYYIKEAFLFLKSHGSIRFILLIGIVASACITYVDEFWQLYVKEINIPLRYFGIISASNLLIRSMTGIFAYRLKKYIGYKVIYSILLLVYAIAMLTASFNIGKIGIILIVISYCTVGIIEPLVYGYMHHRVESSYRATVESFQSLVMRGAVIIVGLLFGWFSTNYSIFVGFRSLGYMLLIYFIYYFIFQFKYIK